MNPKKLAGFRAVEFVKDGMILGLGTGSTVYFTLIKLGELVKEGLNIKGIPTSKKTEEIAKKFGIPLTTLDKYPQIDLTIDGADEVDENFNLIKGGGGALLREKIVAKASKKYIVVVDSSKLVRRLGQKSPLPVEVLPFGWRITKQKLENLGLKVEIRKKDNKYYLTDNTNYILNCSLRSLTNMKGGIKGKIRKQIGILPDLESLEYKINTISGVIENGFFLNIADIVIVGTEKECKILEKGKKL